MQVIVNDLINVHFQINASYLINVSKILGIFRKKEQSQMFNSFSYLLDLYFCVLSATQIKHMITIITRKIQKCRK